MNRTIALEDLIAQRLGSVNPLNFPQETFDLLSIPAYDSGEPVVSLGTSIGSTKQLVQPGDVLLSKIVPHIRRAWIVPAFRGLRQIASSEWIVFRSEDADPNYLRHVLTDDQFHAEFMSTVSGVGGSLLRARPAYVGKIKIFLPTLTEQRRIATILDQAEALCTKRNRAIKRLTALREQVFIDFFGDPSLNPKGWPVCCIGDLISSSQYGTSVKSNDSGAIPVLRMNNITAYGSIDISALKYMTLKDSELERWTVRRGDILFNRTNSAELVGKTAVFDQAKPMAYAGYLVRLRVNDLATPEYVSAFLNSKYGKAVLRGMCKSIVGMANINAKEVQTIRIPKPAIEIQRKFSKYLDALATKVVVYNESRSGMEQLFLTLQHRAFRGEL